GRRGGSEAAQVPEGERLQPVRRRRRGVRRRADPGRGRIPVRGRGTARGAAQLGLRLRPARPPRPGSPRPPPEAEMSTLEVMCGRCDKKFRVRAEFAGRSTRCPGCSAPLTIAGARPATPARTADPEVERPRPRPRPRDDEEDAHRRSTGDWKPVDLALGREQMALVFLLVQVFCTFIAICLGRSAAPGGIVNSPAILLVAILVAGPTLAAG